MKSYSDCMKELSSDDLYEGLLGYGLFSEKLPPIFSSKSFYDFCKKASPSFNKEPKTYIHYESIRNTNVPRELGIPNPMAYQRLCKCVADNWDKIKKHFLSKTGGENHKISRTHIRKLVGKNELFEMNYDNWRTDGTPEPDLLLGSRYIVHADISTCFASMYTHSLSWALVGKDVAKVQSSNKFKDMWYNQIDYYVRRCKNGETHGFLIGPHVYNLLSEIILTAIDDQLSKKWKYIRHIDDFTCYVDSYENGQQFLISLSNELRQYDLSLNHKKTEIKELPVAITEQWVHQIGNPKSLCRNEKFDYISARTYLDFTIDIMHRYSDNSAILNYAVKALPFEAMTLNAKDYCVKTISYLCLLYPYLVQIIDEFVFERFAVEHKQIQNISQKIFDQELHKHNYEGVCYALYFSLKYNFPLNGVAPKDSIESNSCLFRLLSFLYFKSHNQEQEKNELYEFALTIGVKSDEFSANWLFVYETLSKTDLLKIDLLGEWTKLKKNKISFLKTDTCFNLQSIL